MKIAITHDILMEFGGAERVLQSLLHIYPEAHIYTLYLNNTVLTRFDPPLNKNNIHVIPTKFIGLEPISHLFQPLSPFIWRSLNFEKYDVVISSSAMFLCNVINVRHPLHVQYIHSPPKNIFGLSSIKPIQKFFNYAPIIASQYIWAVRRYPHIIVNSRHIQRELRRISGASSTVIYPPVYVPTAYHRSRQRKYFLIISRIDEQKNVELAIRACTKLGVPLKIVGEASDGGYIAALRRISGPTVEFLGFRKTVELSRLYEEAIAFLFTPRCEDFGIAPVEAMAHGVPVIAFYGGGVRETVTEGLTGAFFYEYTVDALIKVISRFNSGRFFPAILHKAATKYDVHQFEKKMSQFVEKGLEQHIHV